MDVLSVIRKEMKAKRVTSKELAEACAVSQVQMSKYLNKKNKLPLDIAQTCTEHLGLSLIVGKVIE